MMAKYIWSSKQDERREARRPKPVKKKVMIKPLSKKRATQNKEYLKLKNQYLEDNPICQINICCISDKSTQVHHSKGRIGELLTNTKFFIACCQDCHRWAEDHPVQAKRFKYFTFKAKKIRFYERNFRS